MYKTRLQELCHQKRWGLPRYSAMKDGPDHIPSFKASVSVNGLTFDCLGPSSSAKLAQNEAAMLAFLHFTSSEPPSPSPPTNFNQMGQSQLQNYDPCMMAKSSVDGQRFERPAILSTSKEAEQAAEKIGLMSLSLDKSHKGDSGVYKNLLTELAQREGVCKPTYKTIRSGTVQMPTFFSIVEVEGKEFHGEPMTSKKQAEREAAKVAYFALKDYKAEDKDVNMVDEMLPDIVKVNNEIFNPSSSLQTSEKDMMKNLQPSKAMDESSAKELDLSALSVTDVNKAKTPEASSYLIHDRIRVYTSFPDFPFPEGITILPVRENRWVAVSLEFPNEKQN